MQPRRRTEGQHAATVAHLSAFIKLDILLESSRYKCRRVSLKDINPTSRRYDAQLFFLQVSRTESTS